MIPRVQLVAHRGASALRPEHTLAAFELALEQGADALECDVRLTSDGHLVCVHDRTVNRTSGSTGVVSELTLAQLSQMDFGGERGVVTLRTLVELALEQKTGLFIETKHPVRFAGQVETKLVALLEEYGLAEQDSKDDSPVVVMSFSTRAVRRVRALAPSVPTVLLIDRMWPWLRTGAQPAFADYTGPGMSLLRADPGYVARAAAAGHGTYVWTVDDPEDIRFCRDIGVRWLATNDPAAARAALT